VRLSPPSLVLALVVLVPLIAGCQPAPLKRAVKGGAVDRGPGSLEAVRRQLQGTWELVDSQAFDAAGTATSRKAAGRLTYDEYGNLTIAATVEDTGQTPSGVSGLLGYTGRAVIDPAKTCLVLTDVKGRQPSSQALPAEVSADKVRYYTVEGNTLTLTVKNAAGAVTERTTWRKVPAQEKATP
jgi:hypothetical protein